MGQAHSCGSKERSRDDGRAYMEMPSLDDALPSLVVGGNADFAYRLGTEMRERDHGPSTIDRPTLTLNQVNQNKHPPTDSTPPTPPTFPFLSLRPDPSANPHQKDGRVAPWDCDPPPSLEPSHPSRPHRHRQHRHRCTSTSLPASEQSMQHYVRHCGQVLCQLRECHLYKGVLQPDLHRQPGDMHELLRER
ncbi:hypothetical protein BC936DRAFT_141662 [Jimgerdemannia flammicorona]|uniref:Uncharacterized protein n=1 Tax=Jimgerdemannia flammicorona TaxID=994334 RepID=A0A433DFY2_9FUNG|nr:hypothetical protein BC936DRAFT_141662 [Jimgerdemannia flammicorona]